MMTLRQLPLLLALGAVGLLLALLPLPGVLGLLRPHWLLVIFAAWLHARGDTGLLVVAVVFGLLQDAAHGVTLGVHAMALLLPLGLWLRWRAFFTALPLWQGALSFAALALMYVVLLQTLDAMTGEQYLARMRWLALPATVLVWPLAVLLLSPRAKTAPPA